MTEYDERVLDYQKITYGNYILKMMMKAYKMKLKNSTPCLFTWVLSYYQTVNDS